jgi:thiamine pyrophosphate-dependent acetolactate synthase large subunit-like protein
MDRRSFLTQTAGAAASAAALGGATPVQGQSPAQSPASSVPRETEDLTTDRCGADVMVDVLKAIGFEFVCANPGSSFRALHEALVNYGGNTHPELITCCHEESSVAMAHGFAKIDGRPIAVMAHGTVGLQHAAMAVYNAYCDRVPVYVVVGNTLDATERRPGVEWTHSVQDAASLVRDFSKWDDTPISLEHFAESAVRGYTLAVTPPMGPVLLVADSELQERPLAADFRLRLPRISMPAPPHGDVAAIAEAARLLVDAENPVIVADRVARTPAGLVALVELAETLQASVIDQGGRMNFPSRHVLNQSAQGRTVLSSADVVLGLELTDFWGTTHTYRDQLHRSSRSILKPGAKAIAISTRDLGIKANYQDFQRFAEIDLAISGDAEATLPSLVHAVKRLVTPDRRRAFDDRGKTLAGASQNAFDRARVDAGYGWDASPVSTARLSLELWEAIRNDDWSLVSYLNPVSNWPLRLWTFDKHHQFIGGSGGSGIGYTAPASIGAALANKKHGRLTVTIQPDGDLMYAPGVLWTAAHHRIPLLMVVHNNRAYHQELMHLQRMANRHNRGADRAHVGTTIADPNIDYARLAEGLGVHGVGPIDNPADLAPAFKRALDVVRRGEPALVDVVTQPR